MASALSNPRLARQSAEMQRTGTFATGLNPQVIMVGGELGDHPVPEIHDWFMALDEISASLVRDSVELLAERGPSLGRLAVDRITGSELHNLKELRPGSAGKTEIRILFIFDPQRQAVLLVAGDKSGNCPRASVRHIKMVAAGLGLEAGGPVGGDAVAEAAVGPMKAAGLAGFLRKLAVCPDTVDQYAHFGFLRCAGTSTYSRWTFCSGSDTVMSMKLRAYWRALQDTVIDGEAAGIRQSWRPWRLRSIASGATAMRQPRCATSWPAWEFPVPASTIPLATSVRCSLWRSSAISITRHVRGSSELEETSSPKHAVRRFIEEIIERSLTDRERRGCFLINSALEVAPHDKALGALIADRLGEVEAFFCRSIRAAQAEGTVPPDRAPKDLARMLLGVLLGIRVLARANPDRALLEGVARPALALLDFSNQQNHS